MKCPYCFQDYDPIVRADRVRLKRIENAKNSAKKRNAKKESEGK